MSVRITAVAKELPPYTRETKEILPFVETWLDGQEERFKRKVLKLFEGAGVDRRYSIMDAEEVFAPTNFEERNAIYMREMRRLGKESLEKALNKAQWKA
ncbi:MAG: type III polyketide synthase, partial [Flavobacteriaceae bacterium]|nr:type III polyketide synthase [Flavobacteriaceae bacterium]